MNLQGEEFLPTGPAPRSDTQPQESAAGLALSAVLHCFALLFLFVVGISGTEGSEGGLQIVQQNAAAAAKQRVADLPRSDVAQLPPDPAHIAATPLPQPARTDELQAKLEALAKLRQPDAVTPNQDNGAARPDKVATNDDIGSGE